MVKSELIKNDIALGYSFQPKQLPFREKEYQQIIKLINSFDDEKDGINILVYGPRYAEKLHVIRSIFYDYEEKKPDVFVAYVNCWSENTSHKIISCICDAIGCYPNNNEKIIKSFDNIKKLLLKKTAIFIFDEIEHLKDFEFLKLINKEVAKKSIILMTNHKEFLDKNLKSILKVKNVEFKSYNLNETRGVFKQRMDIALYPNVLDSDAFDLITKKSFEMGNIKLGISILRKACIEAELKGLIKVTKVDIQRAIDDCKVILNKN